MAGASTQRDGNGEIDAAKAGDQPRRLLAPQVECVLAGSARVPRFPGSRSGGVRPCELAFSQLWGCLLTFD